MSTHDSREPARDELLEKLDDLIQRHRRETRATDPAAVPTLTAEPDAPREHVPAPSSEDEAVPTLTEAVLGPGRRQAAPVSADALDRIVAARLFAAIEREIARIAADHSDEAPRLQRVRDTLARVLPDLLRHARRLTERDGGDG